jgi:hypothetical protein
MFMQCEMTILQEKTRRRVKIRPVKIEILLNCMWQHFTNNYLKFPLLFLETQI